MYTSYQLSWFFLVYSFAGWCIGVIVNAVRKKKFINTGFMGLPFCPSYGVGALGYCIFLSELRGKLFFLFLGGAVLGALCCVMTGILLEHIFHRKWWDYSKNRLQFEGYLSIWHLVFFGAAAVLILCVANPLLVSLLDLIPSFAGEIVLMVLECLIGIDFAVSLIAVMELKIKLRRMKELAANMQKVTDHFGTALTTRIQNRMMKVSGTDAEQIISVEAAKKPKRVFAEGCCFYKLVWLFLIGAFLGDITETVFCRFSLGTWMSRSSVVYGPFSVVWGLGCAVFTALLYKYKNCSDAKIFLSGTLLGGTYEYVCSVFTELVFGTVFWDYSKIPFNLGGRINLLFCFFWGIAAVVWLKVIYPALSRLIEKAPIKPATVVTWICIVFMVFNGGVSCLALARYSERATEAVEAMASSVGEASYGDGAYVDSRSALEVFLDGHFPDERMEKIYPKAKIVNKGLRK